MNQNSITQAETLAIEEPSRLPSNPDGAPRSAPSWPSLIWAIIWAGCLIVSLVWARPTFSSPETWSHQIEILSEKQTTVTALAASTAGASAAISLLPGDAGSSIADQLADLSSRLVIILAAVYLEKYLLTTLGYTAFTFLVPIGCGLGIVSCLLSFFHKEYSPWKPRCTSLGLKLGALGLAIVLIVPASVGLSDMIEATYEEASNTSITETTQQIDEGANQVRDNSGDTNSDSNSDTEADSSESNGGGILSFLGNAASEVGTVVTNGITTITQGAQDALNLLQTALSHAMEAFAVMIVTSCLIPLLVMLFFFWLVRLITGIDLQFPTIPKPSVTGHTPGNAIKAVRKR